MYARIMALSLIHSVSFAASTVERIEIYSQASEGLDPLKATARGRALLRAREAFPGMSDDDALNAYYEKSKGEIDAVVMKETLLRAHEQFPGMSDDAVNAYQSEGNIPATARGRALLRAREVFPGMNDDDALNAYYEKSKKEIDAMLMKKTLQKFTGKHHSIGA